MKVRQKRELTFWLFLLRKMTFFLLLGVFLLLVFYQ